ncbi:MAG: OsmC family protein [Bacteroidetes bacterium]|nr:OsmC family protein [Bacteroidota bacterium]MBS1591272.1 OsmC family protein [Bacteroidota bacterium]MBS1639101.1 OsmC family protein [Bacteroidota bacterium]MBS1641821.1 OsmC family protein [Bacteroidota bacterium]MBS1670732.1 OsmC family protein [Bacteroidota bacterium]
MIRTATAVWNGSGKEGKGIVSTQSGVLSNTQYSFVSRFENGIGTNPEELVAAAHAGCFAMKLSFVLGAAGFTPEALHVKCELEFKDGSITKSHLIVEGKIENINKDQFNTAVKDAEANCPISKLLNTAISSEAILL